MTMTASPTSKPAEFSGAGRYINRLGQEIVVEGPSVKAGMPVLGLVFDAVFKPRSNTQTRVLVTPEWLSASGFVPLAG